MSLSRRRFLQFTATSAVAAVAGPHIARAAKPTEVRLDWAYYNPVSLLLKEQGILEKELAGDGIGVRWVQSAGSNKALEFLNAGSIDFGSTAGAAALLGKINSNPIKSIYVYSRPEWTALVTRGDTPIKTVADLKGKSVAVTRGTDPHIFLMRALADSGLSDKQVKFVLLQHPDGATALLRGDVDAWAGLDPMMAAAEVDHGARLFYRDKAKNTWGILNVREEFAKEQPELVGRVLKAYEKARAAALANPAGLRSLLAAQAKISEAVAKKQLDERTELNHSAIGAGQIETIVAAGLALQQAGVIKPDINVQAVTSDLVDQRFNSALKA
jgi:sulfonate transport system substrate-binding protein